MHNKQKTEDKHRNVIAYAVTGLFLLPILIIGGLHYIVKNDTALDDIDSFYVQNQTSKVIETKYFNIILNRIPLRAEVYDPENSDLNYTIGLDISTDKLNFGTIPPNTPARKQLKMANDRNGPVKIIIEPQGNISKYISIESNNIILEPQMKKDIIVDFVGSEIKGFFEGELYVKIIVPPEDAYNQNIFKSIFYDLMIRLA